MQENCIKIQQNENKTLYLVPSKNVAKFIGFVIGIHILYIVLLYFTYPMLDHEFALRDIAPIIPKDPGICFQRLILA